MDEAPGAPNMEEYINDRVQSSLNAHKEDMLKEIGVMFSKISDSNKSSQLTKISHMMAVDTHKFKRKSNEEQHKFNQKIHIKLEEADQLTGDTTKCKAKIEEAKEMVVYRQKLIKIADSSELGWRVVGEYESNPLADDSDDERKIYKAEARASKKVKAEKAKRGKSARSVPYKKPQGRTQTPIAVPSTSHTPTVKPGSCFACGKSGHWRKECPEVKSYNKISIDTYILSNSLSSEMTAEEQDGNTYRHVVYNMSKVACTSKNASHSDKVHGKANGCLEPEQLVSEKTQGNTIVVSPVGRLKEHTEKWKQVAGDFILDVIKGGYKIPFKTFPKESMMKNNKSSRDSPIFVESEIKALVEKGIVSEVTNKPLVVNPLTVAYNRKGKPRLVLDCRHINSHIHLFKVKFEDIKVAGEMFLPGSFCFTFDLKGAYHHIDICNEHKTFLGFCWVIDGVLKYFVFNSLPFGLSSAGHIFTKVLRVVVTYIRSYGHKVVMYLDDGIGGHDSYEQAIVSSDFVKMSLVDFGFLLADEKCSWEPIKKVTWLGNILDFYANRLFITNERIDRLESSIISAIQHVILDKFCMVPVRVLASIVGQIISLQFVLGNVVRMRTRNLYKCILARASWNAPVKITGSALQELKYWKSNVRNMNNEGRPLRRSETCEYSLYCDASGDGNGWYLVYELTPDVDADNLSSKYVYESPPEVGMLDIVLPEVSLSFDERKGGKDMLPEVSCHDAKRLMYNRVDTEYVYSTLGSEVIPIIKTGNRTCSSGGVTNEVTGTWSTEERLQSSTWRETEAVRRLIKSHANDLVGKSIKVYSDNKNVKSVITNGSNKPVLQYLATDINDLCKQHDIVLCPEWIPRAENELADHLSRCKDSDDWYISKRVFMFLSDLWGCHTIDRFASNYNNNCSRFNSKWWVPYTEGINAFDHCWQGENNWLVPPPSLVVDCLNKIKKTNAPPVQW